MGRLAVVSVICVACAALVACTSAVAADALVYITLAQPCRLLDTRTSQSGPGPLTSAHGNYTFGTSDADIQATTQNGNSAGCGLPTGISAVSVTVNQLATTAAGNIRVWSTDAGTTGPSAGTAVYNPSVATPASGQVLYNGGYATIPVGSSDQRFYLAVANGQIDLTVNVAGYWLPVSVNATRSGPASNAFGYDTVASGYSSFATGDQAKATNDDATAIGLLTKATGQYTFASGNSSSASGLAAVAMGLASTASGDYSIALGHGSSGGQYGFAAGNNVSANGTNSVALGANANSGSFSDLSGQPIYWNHGFVFGDGSASTQGTANNQFVARASGGFLLYSSTATQGVSLAAGSSAWTSLSDRNAKDAVTPIDGRVVLDRVVTMPLATWHYKSQDAKYRHMGPMAQDFYAAFGLGESDTGIDTIDADGVALAAIQGLNAKLELERGEHADALAERDRRIALLEADNASIRAQVAELVAAIKHPAGAAAP